MKRTISAMVGKGSVSHNSRNFIAENVDVSRTKNNMNYCNRKIQDVYHELFDESLKKYNAKQTRADRVIDDYYEKIRTGKQEKIFHEIIFQIGDKDNMSAETENGELSKRILDKYMHDFEKRNPNLRVFSAHLHMDEATPHLHVDFVPFTTGSKRGLETRVSLKKALGAQGFKGGSRYNTEWNQWVSFEKEKLAEVMLEYGIEWEKKGTHEKHRGVSEFKRDELAEEIDNLTEKKKKLENKMSTAKAAEEYALTTVRKIKDNKDLELPEPPIMMSAKTYKTKYAEPPVKRLLKFIYDLTRRCFRAEKEMKEATGKMSELYREKENLKSTNWDLMKQNSKLRTQLRDFDKLKEILGIDKIKEILKTKKIARNRTDMSR